MNEKDERAIMIRGTEQAWQEFCENHPEPMPDEWIYGEAYAKGFHAARASSPAVPSDERHPILASVPDGAWSLDDIVEKLIEATTHLLDGHNCDTHGYEGFTIANALAKEWLANSLDHVSRPTWIRVEDGLPSEDGVYLFYEKEMGFVAVYFHPLAADRVSWASHYQKIVGPADSKGD